MIRLVPLSALLFLLSGCATVPPSAAPAGTYRAMGTEPFWNLTIDTANVRFTEANSPQVVMQPTPRVIMGFAGEIYQTPRINVNIVHARCSDGMSDRTYPDKVQVRVDGRSFEGCGGEPMAPATVANTSWSVLAVNGRTTPRGERFSMRFEEERIAARFGCNSIGGGYRTDGATLTPGALAMTRMACPDMSFEDQAARVLSQPVQMTFRPGDQLSLENTAGSILLKRGY